VKKSRWFAEKELTCHCGCGACDMNPVLLRMLDQVRSAIGKPIIINSGYRCVEWNRKVRGRNTSAHLTGHAVDIKCTNATQRYELLNDLLPRWEIRRLGIADNFIHIDIDPSKPQDVVWTYDHKES